MMTSGRRSLAVVVCSLSTFIVNVDGTAYQVAVTPIRETLPATFAQGQWILSGYSLTLAALVIVAGALGDRFNKRNLLVAGLIIYIVGSVLTALAPNAFVMIAARILAAVGASVLVPVGLGMVRVLARSQQELHRFTGAWGIAVGLGMATGPLAAGLIAGALGWRLIPVATAALAAGFAVLSLILLPSTRAHTPPRQDWPGIVLLGAAMFAFIGLLIALDKRQLLTPMALLAVVATLFGCLFRRRRSGRFPIPDQACRSPRFRTAMYVAVGNYFCVGGAIFLLATAFLQGSQHLSPVWAGLSLVPLAVGYAVGARLSPVIMRSRGPYQVIAVAGLLTLASSLAIALLTTTAASIAAVSFVAAFLGGGMGMANTPTNVLAMSELSGDYAVISGAFASVARQAGQAMGIAVCGAAYSLSVSAHLSDAVPWAALLVAAAGVTFTGLSGPRVVFRPNSARRSSQCRCPPDRPGSRRPHWLSMTRLPSFDNAGFTSLASAPVPRRCHRRSWHSTP